METTKQQLRDIGARAEAALNEAFKAEGIVFTRAGGQFGFESMVKFTLLKAGKPGEDPAKVKEAAQRKEFAETCGMFGLKPEHYRAEFDNNGNRFALVSCHPDRHTYPFVGEVVGGRRTTGKRFKFTRDVIAKIKKA